MPFKDLETTSLADFIRAEQTKPGDFWLFMHIPKTAGSSFSVELSTRLHPYTNIYLDGVASDLPYNMQLGHAVDRFIDLQRISPYKSASGHLPYEQADKFKKTIPQSRLITFLRAPVARVVSDYRYQRTPMHPTHLEFRKQFPTLESYVAAKHEQNKMARFVFGKLPGVDERQLIDHAAQNFDFIGLLEMYPMSFQVAFDLMGHPGLTPIEHQRKTPDIKEAAVDLTDDLRRMIKRANKLDQALYDYVREVLKPRREEWKLARKA